LSRRLQDEARSSEERFRELTESLPQLVWTCDREGRCDYLGRQWVAFTGRAAEPQLGFGWLEQVHEDDRAELIRRWSEAVRTSSGFMAEFRIRRHDGVYRWFDTRATPRFDSDGAVLKWFGSNIDVTERRLVAEELRTSEERLQTVIANMTEGLVISDLSGQLLHWNPAGLVMHGFTSMEECLMKLPEFQKVFELSTLEGHDLAFDEWPLPRIIRGEVLESLELRIRRTDKEWERFFCYNGAIVREPSGTRVAFLTISDQTASKLAAAASKESEERLRIANEAGGIGTFDADLLSQRCRVSAEMRELLGLLPSSELSLASAVECIHPGDRELFRRQLAAGADPKHGGRSRLELRIVRPDGETRWVSTSAQTFFAAVGERLVPVRAVGACFDVTDRRRAEQRLATQNAVSRALAEASNLAEAAPKVIQALCESEGWDLGAIWQVDPNGSSLRCAEIWHRPEAELAELARATLELELDCDESLPGRVWRAGAPVFLPDVAREPHYLRREAVLRAGLQCALAFPILERGEVSGVIDFVGTARGSHAQISLDLFALVGCELGLFLARKRSEEERERLAARLRQSQKMEAIGQLSGGIAHDFNNILSALIGNTQLAQSMVPLEDPLQELLAEMAEASRRASGLVKQILAFARQQPLARRVIDLAAVVDESVRLLRATLPAGIELSVSAAPDVPPILADPTQIHQVVVNLATNAWHAIEGDSGRIQLLVDAVELDAEECRAFPDQKPGMFARLRVRDNGKGMDPFTLERIFEPFFTTKGTGKGTGLGLSVVHGIVQDHEGVIQVQSSMGAGTELSLYFPAVSSKVDRLSVLPPAPHSGRGQLVMYVDDEEALVKVVQQSLIELGYRVCTFTRAAAALEVFRSAPESFALVISDMNMPGVSGLRFLEQLRGIRRDLPTILISGHIPESLKARAEQLGVRRLLYKPCSLEELGEAVHAAIDGSELAGSLTA
jgi:PAS domain S-box-containing protein